MPRIFRRQGTPIEFGDGDGGNNGNGGNHNPQAQEDFPRALWRVIRIPALATAALILAFIAFSMFTAEVPAGFVGFKKHLGSLEGASRNDPGLVFIMPGVQSLELYPTRTLATSHDAAPRDSINQVIKSNLNVQLFINPSMAGKLLQNVGDMDALRQKIVDPQIATQTQAETPTYSSEDLVQKRPQLVANIRARLQKAIDEKLTEYGVAGALTVGEVALVDFKFGDQFAQSIESKVRQEQLRETADINKKITEIKADADGQSTEILARASAQATKLLADANADAIKLKGAVASQSKLLGIYEAVENWDGASSRVVIPNSGNTSLMLNVPQAATK
jgi:regulator of protease activity HflC (stomatin/prohibitin superfamily)